MSDFVKLSLETHLFFCRIMKEHSLFLMAGFPGKNKEHIAKADWYREQFENLLREVVELSDGMVGRDVLESGEVTTEFTKKAEKCTNCLTGIPIDSTITERSERLSPVSHCQQREGNAECWQRQRSEQRSEQRQYTGQRRYDNRGQWQQNRQNFNRMQSNQYRMNQRNQCSQRMTEERREDWREERREEQRERLLREINNRALELVEGLISFKEEVLCEVRKCNLFTANYPLLIEHILREAKLYRDTIIELNERGELCLQTQREMEQFWNQIMMEHALFIRGLLDPSEEELVRMAHEFSMDYRRLLEEAKGCDMRTMDDLTRRTIRKTEEYQKFKSAGTKGISNCEIESIILPLLADHVLREANHYLRLLKM